MVMPREGHNNATNEGRSKPVRADRATGSKSIDVPLRLGLIAVSLACWAIFLADEVLQQPRAAEARFATQAVAASTDSCSAHAATASGNGLLPNHPGVAR